MKCLSLVSVPLFLFLLGGTARASLPTAVPDLRPTKQHTNANNATARHRRRRPSATGLVAAVSIRGGDLGAHIRSQTLAQILSGLAAADALCGVLAPVSSMKWFFGVDIAKGSLSEHYLHGIGASATTTALALGLSVSGTTSTIEQAVACGFLGRLASMTAMIATNRYHELGMNNAMFGTMWTALAVTTYALFTGTWEAKTLTKLVSVLLGFHGVFLYLKPETFMKRAAGVDKGEPKAKLMASIDGGYMAVSALVTGLLVGGVPPEEVAGYASLAFMPVVLKLLDVGDAAFFGINMGTLVAVVVALLATITTGTVLSK